MLILHNDVHKISHGHVIRTKVCQDIIGLDHIRSNEIDNTTYLMVDSCGVLGSTDFIVDP